MWIDVFATVLLQGPGIIGLNQLRSLRVLDLAGNAMLSVEHVLQALKGGDPDFEVPALRKPWSDSDVNRPLPIRTLESVTLGIRSSKNQASSNPFVVYWLATFVDVGFLGRALMTCLLVVACSSALCKHLCP